MLIEMVFCWLIASVVFYKPITYIYLFFANLILASQGKATVKIKKEG
jgi:hypothetical protein